MAKRGRKKLNFFQKAFNTVVKKVKAVYQAAIG